MTTVSLRFDDDMKRELDSMCDSMGMNLTTFFTIYAKRALRDRRIPFDIVASDDPFYSEGNMKALLHSKNQMENGQHAIHELAEM